MTGLNFVPLGMIVYYGFVSVGGISSLSDSLDP